MLAAKCSSNNFTQVFSPCALKFMNFFAQRQSIFEVQSFNEELVFEEIKVLYVYKISSVCDHGCVS